MQPQADRSAIKANLLGEAAKFEVSDTIKPIENLIVHKGKVKKGSFKTGDAVLAKVEADDRLDTARHHTVTHILHATLRSVLGEHVKQAGSLVAPDRLRFDFTHYTALTDRERERIEEIVNERIIENHPVETVVMDIDQAVASGAMALFDEKYGDKVRVVTVKEVSKELCGGTHTRASGDIGSFKIISEAGVAAGVRRIEAVAGRRAYQDVQARGAGPPRHRTAAQDNRCSTWFPALKNSLPRPGTWKKSSTSLSTNSNRPRPGM